MDEERDIIFTKFNHKYSQEQIIKVHIGHNVSVLFRIMRELYQTSEYFFDILAEGEEQIVWPQELPEYLITIPNCEYTFYVKSETSKYLSNILIENVFCFRIGNYFERMCARKLAENIIKKLGLYEQNIIEDYAIKIARREQIDICEKQKRMIIQEKIESELSKL